MTGTIIIRKTMLGGFSVFKITSISSMPFESFWEVPATHPTAIKGYWVKGPDKDFFDVIQENIPEAVIIAEDLGYITPEVEELLAQTQYPGMKILQFAFDGSDNKYLPHNFIKNCIG